VTITTRVTRTGRVIIESDGASDYYGGALVQGATICRISAPADVAARYTDSDGIELRRLLCDLKYDKDGFGLNDVRVLDMRHVH
jgi:hypothetical protein